jgi:hypothetical protein
MTGKGEAELYNMGASGRSIYKWDWSTNCFVGCVWSNDPSTAFWYRQSGGQGYQNLVYDSFSQSGNDFHAAKELRPLGGSATASTASAKVGQTVLALVCYVVDELCFSLSLSLSLRFQCLHFEHLSLEAFMWMFRNS